MPAPPWGLLWWVWSGCPSSLLLRLTLHQDLAQGAGIAGSAGRKTHVLARVRTGQIVQDERARAIGVFNEDVVRVHVHWLPIWKGGRPS